jgi:Tfp pilus assembly protein FimT
MLRKLLSFINDINLIKEGNGFYTKYKLAQSGFTIVEILVVFSIFVMVTTAGMVSFRQYSTHQILETSAADLISFIGHVRTSAVSQVIESPCVSQLQSYNIKIVGSSNYEMWVYCNSSSYQVRSRSLPNDVVFDSGTTSEISFAAGRGTSPGGVIRLRGAFSTKILQIDTAGNVSQT